jgi:hypothetical protein
VRDELAHAPQPSAVGAHVVPHAYDPDGRAAVRAAGQTFM